MNDYKLPNYDVSEKELGEIAEEITSLMNGKTSESRISRDGKQINSKENAKLDLDINDGGSDMDLRVA